MLIEIPCSCYIQNQNEYRLTVWIDITTLWNIQRNTTFQLKNREQLVI